MIIMFDMGFLVLEGYIGISAMSAYVHASSKRRIQEQKWVIRLPSYVWTQGQYILSAIATSPFDVDVSTLSVPSAWRLRQ